MANADPVGVARARQEMAAKGVHPVTLVVGDSPAAWRSAGFTVELNGKSDSKSLRGDPAG